MQTKRSPFHVKSTGQLPVLRLFSARSSFWLAATLSSHCMTPSGQRRWTRVGLIVRPEAEHDGRDRLAQARLGRRVVVGDVQPLPFDEHPGSDRVRVGPHQLGLDPPVAAELQCQPVLAVAQVSRERGGFARPNDEDIGQGVADQVDGHQPVEAGAGESKRQRLGREASPFVARPGGQERLRRACSRRRAVRAGRAGRRGPGRWPAPTAS